MINFLTTLNVAGISGTLSCPGNPMGSLSPSGSKYFADKKRVSAVGADPNKGLLMLLHVPSIVLYSSFVRHTGVGFLLQRAAFDSCFKACLENNELSDQRNTTCCPENKY